MNVVVYLLDEEVQHAFWNEFDLGVDVAHTRQCKGVSVNDLDLQGEVFYIHDDILTMHHINVVFELQIYLHQHVISYLCCCEGTCSTT